MVDRSPSFMQALSRLKINKQKICSDEFLPCTIISLVIFELNVKNYSYELHMDYLNIQHYYFIGPF